MKLAWLPLLLALPSCAPTRPSDGDALEVLVPTPPTMLDPRYTTDPVGMRVTRLVHAGLVRLDEDTLEPRPYVAASWAWEGDQALVFTLRDGVTFASGARVEAADVCATIAAFGSDAVASPHRGLVAAIARCTEPSARQVRIELREPRATLLTDMELPVLRRDQATSAPGSDLDGLGPFRLARVEESEVRLAARDGGALGGRPPRDVVVRVVRDETARATRLLAGRADVVPNAISPPMLAALRERGVHIASRPGANLTYLMLHNQRPGLDRPDVRRALGQALDRATLVATLLGGYARVADSFVPPESWAYRAPREALAFDPQQARATLQAAGVKRLTLLSSTDRQRVTMGRAVAQMLGDVGVEVELLPLDLGVMLHRLSSGDFEAAILQIPELTEPNVLRWFFHSASIPGPGRAGANRARYASAAVDAWLDEASRRPELPVRRALYRDLLGQMLDDLPIIPLFHEDQVAACSARAAGFRPSAEGRWLSLAR